MTSLDMCNYAPKLLTVNRRRRRHGLSLLPFIFLTLWTAAPEAALADGTPSIVYTGTTTQQFYGGIGAPINFAPGGVAIDLSGNVYISDHDDNEIIKVTPGGPATVLTISGVSLSTPTRLAVDSAGNLYINDSGHNRLVKATPSGPTAAIGAPFSTGSISLNLSFTSGVAVDTSGNVFISDSGNNRIVEIPSMGQAFVLVTNSGLAIDNNSLNNPKGLATDTFNNLYICDAGNSRMIKVTPAPSLVGSTVSFSGSPFFPSGVTVASNGVVYAADPGKGRITVSDPQGHMYDLFVDTQNHDFGTFDDIAIDGKGAIYIVNGAHAVVDLFHFGSADFGHVQVGGTASNTQTLNFVVNTTITGRASYTAGTQNLDFTIAADSGTECTTGSANLACTVVVQFKPTAAGLRRGALVLSYASGSLTVPLFGIGDAPVGTLSPGVASVLNTSVPNTNITSIGRPFQVAYDGAGNMYATDRASAVFKIPPRAEVRQPRCPFPI